MAQKRDFINAVNDVVLHFSTNKLCRGIAKNEFTMADYHRFLLTLFHQVFDAPGIISRAAANCPAGYEVVRDYMLQDAGFVKDSWKKVLADLEATGYDGPDPRESFPNPATQAFIAFNYYVAVKAPVARMAVTSVLEGISANFSLNYSQKLFSILDLKPQQISFMYRERESVKIEKIYETIDAAPMTEEDWAWMAHVAATGGRLYHSMYDVVMDGK